MNYYGYELIRESDLTHHGIKGQKWGIRRFQNKDGTLTAAGKKRREKTSEEPKHMSDKTKVNLKKAAKIGAAVVATGLVAYGAYKIGKNLNNKAIAELIASDEERGRKATKEMMYHLDRERVFNQHVQEAASQLDWKDADYHRRNAEFHANQARKFLDQNNYYRNRIKNRDYSIGDRIEVLENFYRRR